MTWSLVNGQDSYPSITGSSPQSRTITAGIVGNIFICTIVVAAGSPTPTGLSGGGVGTWNNVVNALSGNSTTPSSMSCWWGVLDGSANPTTLSVSFSGSLSSTNLSVSVYQFSSSTGSMVGRPPTLDTSGTFNQTVSGATVNWPSLATAGSGELYFGYAQTLVGTITTGTTSGITYLAPGDAICHNVNTSGSPIAPTRAISPNDTPFGYGLLLIEPPVSISGYLPQYSPKQRRIGPMSRRRPRQVATWPSAPPAVGNPIFVQQNTTHHGNTTNTAAVTLGGSSTVGNRIVVEVAIWKAGGATCSGVVDSAGNTYTELLHFTASDSTEMSIWSAPVTTGGVLTVTATATATADMGVAVLEYSGLSAAAGAGCVDVTSQATGTTSVGATVSSGATSATAGGGELAMGFYADSGFNVTVTPGSGLNQRSIVSPASDIELLVEDQTVGAGATPSSTFGTGASTVWMASTVVFLAAGSGGSGSNFTQSPVDDAGSTDSDALAVSQAPVDTAGNTDSSALTVAQAPVDSAGSTDSSALNVSQAPVDSAGSTDSAAIGPAPTDTAGSTDSSALKVTQAPVDTSGTVDSTVLSVVQAPVDTAGSTDSDSLSLAQVQVDSAGSTDAAVVSKVFIQTPVDDAGSTDSDALNVSQAPVDTVGSTDSSALAASQAPVDTAGSTDSSALNVAQAPVDTAGSTDSAIVSRVTPITQVDDAGTTDSSALNVAQAPVDTAGSTDSSALSVAQAPVDTAGSTDSAAIGPAPTDTAGTTDSSALNVAQAPADTAGSTDSKAISVVQAPVDTAGSTDSDSLSLAQVQVDSAGSTDSAAVLKTSTMTFTDDSGSTDSATALKTSFLNFADDAGTTDSASSAKPGNNVPSPRRIVIAAELRLDMVAAESRKVSVPSVSRVYTMSGVDGGS